MAGGKETPRQKMIGMMYLVLTALLALNVSKSILNAFVVVNNGLEVTNKNFNEKNQSLYTAFDQKLALNPTAVKPYHEAAMRVKAEADMISDTIFELKKRLLIKVDGPVDEDPDPSIGNDVNGDGRFTADDKVENLMFVAGKDNYDIPTAFMCGLDVEGQTGEANKLQGMLDKFKSDMLEILKDEKISILKRKTVIENYQATQFGIKTSLTEEEKKQLDESSQNWEMANFYHLAAVACVTNLSKIESDLRNAESDIVSLLLGQIGADDFKFDRLDAKTIAKSTNVPKGSDYEAELFVAAYSSTDRPTIVVGSGVKYNESTEKYELTGDTTHVTEFIEGMGQYKMRGSSVGPKTVYALIEMVKPSGEIKQYVDTIEYMVTEPQAVVSPLKMNVFYLGVENPVGVSVSGYRPDQVKASISNGSMRAKGKKGEYIVKPGKVGKANVTVKVDDGNGGWKNMGGKQEFRVKKVPDPVAVVGGIKGSGSLPKNRLIAAGGVLADLENFDFDLKFKVTKFTISATIDGFTKEKHAKGNKFTAEQKKLIKSAKKNAKVYIENVVAVGPDKKPRKLSPIIIKLK